MDKPRQIWLDNVKIFACILVVLGHFFQSMVSGSILPENGVYRWLDETIYSFHVPLFFICSGYLYQKGRPVNSFSSWKYNVKKKLLALGVPYFTFSLITWLLKTVFASSVNNEVNGLMYSLFVHPMSPYWYLYTLFFVFLVTPTFSGKKMSVVGLVTALIFKVVSIYWLRTDIYAVSTVMGYGIWFVLGMCICVFDLRAVLAKAKRFVLLGAMLGGFFLASSILIHYFNIHCQGMDFLMGLLACAAVLLVAVCSAYGREQNGMFVGLSQYTMPVFLMHTIFAAGLRAVLIKFGALNPVVHIVLGLTISFAGPIITAEIMKRLKLDILLYPAKYIKLQKNN